MTGNMSQEEKDERGEESLLEMIDALILHINEERTWFNILVATSIFAAPVSLLFTVFLLLHPRLVAFIFRADPFLGMVAVVYFVVILICLLYTSDAADE